MSQFDPKGSINPKRSIDPVVIASATTTNGTAVDTVGWRWALCVLSIGTVDGAYTSGVSAVMAASNASGGSFTAIAGATFDAADLLAGDTVQVGRIDLLRLTSVDQRWIRPQVTTAGSAVSVPATLTIILLGPDDSASQDVVYDFAV